MRVAILTQTAIADDPRVHKQLVTLDAAGFDVLGIGTTGARSTSSLPIEEVDGPHRSAAGNAALMPRLLTGRGPSPLSERAYWTLAYNRNMYRRAVEFAPEVVHANDWRVLPIASRLKRELGSKIIYDSHEWAIEEQVDQLRWRLLFPPFVRAIERMHITAADAVITVADGIAELYETEYGLSSRPAVIRNVPPYTAVELRATPEKVTVLYQGVFNANRGLNEVVRSVPLWPASHRLILRGLGSQKQVLELTQLAARVAPDRIAVEGPAPSQGLVQAAASADIGIHALPMKSRQTRFALPNKLFEYIMAGLALCVTDSPEMSRVVRKFDVGVLVPEVSQEAIAEAMESLDPAAINRFRRNSLEAARALNWQAESERLLDVYERLM